MYAYAWENGSYSRLVRTMKCSTGLPETPTPTGTYSMAGQAGRWYYFSKFECWAQYAYRIYGPYLFHSVLYSEKIRPPCGRVLWTTGKPASHGCIRLSVEDAKWLYNNCAAGTTVKIYYISLAMDFAAESLCPHFCVGALAVFQENMVKFGYCKPILPVQCEALAP